MNTFFCRVCHEKVCREKLALFGTEKRKSGSIAYRKLQRERGGRLGKGLICTVAVSLLLDPRTNTRSRLTIFDWLYPVFYIIFLDTWYYFN